VYGPNRLVVLLENAKELVNREREHEIPPSISVVAARFEDGAGKTSAVGAILYRTSIPPEDGG
jgi:hypothetical protein